jgi:hypothetical protein
MSLQGQHLPTEIILIIFEHAIDSEGYLLRTLASVNKALRSALLQRLFQTIHCHSLEHLRQLSQQGWPNVTLPDGSFVRPNRSNLGLALHLHILDKNASLDSHHLCLCNHLLALPESVRNEIDTLIFRMLHVKVPIVTSGVWAPNVCPPRRIRHSPL